MGLPIAMATNFANFSLIADLFQGAANPRYLQGIVEEGLGDWLASQAASGAIRKMKGLRHLWGSEIRIAF